MHTDTIHKTQKTLISHSSVIFQQKIESLPRSALQSYITKTIQKE